MPTTIEQLELEVQSSSTSAVAGIDALSASLSKLKNAVRGGVGLTSVANQVRNLDTALKSMDSSGADKIDKLASSLEKLKGLGSLKISSSIGNQLHNIGSAAASLTGVDFSAMEKLGTALQPLNNLNASGLKSTINALNKLPKLADTLDNMDMTKFTSQIQQLSTALAPLTNQLNAVTAAFNRLPTNIQRAITVTNRISQENNKAANSYMNLYAKIKMAMGAVRTGARVIASWITQSNQYIEDLNLFTASMGEYAQEAQNYAEAVSEALGIDPGEFMRNQGVFNTIISGFGVASDKAYLMSKNLTQLGYDISSFFNISFEDAMQKLQSGIAGELEPLRRLGYDLSVARLQEEALALGIEKKVSAMTQAEKSQLRYYAIMTQVTTAQGDMARTLNAPANQLRVLQAQVTQCARALGNIFIPALNAVLPYAIALAKLLTQFADVVGNNAGLRVHIGMPGKGVQCAGNEQFGRQRQPLRFGFRLHLEQTVKVLQRGRRALVTVADVGQIDLLGAATEDGLFFRGHHAVTDELLKQRQHELRLADDGIALVTIGTIHIQRVDVGVGCGRDADDFTTKGFGQIAELRLRVENEDVILGGKRDLHDFFLGAHALTGAGHAQTEAVAVEQQAAIRHDHVLADGVLPIVQTVRLHDFLCAERNQHGGAFGGKGSQGLDFPQTVRQHRVQPVLLLPAQRGKLAQVLARRGVERFGVAVELLFAVRQMHQCHQPEHHPLVAGRQIVQHFFGFLALEFHIVGNGRGKIVVGVLAALPVGDIRFYAQQCALQLTGGLVCRHRQDIDGQHQVAVKVAKLRHKAVLDVAGIVL